MNAPPSIDQLRAAFQAALGEVRSLGDLKGVRDHFLGRKQGLITADACLVPEPTSLQVCIAERGLLVVDVTIDPTGKVADLAVLHTLGYGIESSVIGTLRTWTFRPATKDGNPIASVQELHFHFGPV